MKFTCSIIINQPREKVVEYFLNPEYLKEYQKEFIRKELISCEIEQEGTISKMYYKMGNGEMELTESILENKLPDYFFAQYHHKHTDNTIKSIFSEIDGNTTKMTSEIEYTAFKGFVVKVMAFLFPGFF